MYVPFAVKKRINTPIRRILQVKRCISTKKTPQFHISSLKKAKTLSPLINLWLFKTTSYIIPVIYTGK